MTSAYLFPAGLKYNHRHQMVSDHKNLYHEMLRTFENILPSELFCEVSHVAILDSILGSYQLRLPNGRLAYHSSDHALQTAHTAYQLAVLEECTQEEQAVVVLAALCHDLGHSFGRLSDADNVKVAAVWADGLLRGPCLNVNPVQEAILCTQYVEGKFPVEPVTKVQRILRDADLLGFTHKQYPEMRVRLHSEMGWPDPESQYDPANWGEALDFLSTCHFYTTWAHQAYLDFVASWRSVYDPCY